MKMRMRPALALASLLAIVALGVGCPDGGGGATDADGTADPGLSDQADGDAPDTADARPADSDGGEVPPSDGSDAAGDDGGTGPANLWEAKSLGDLGELSDLFIVSATEAYAVGGTRVLRYNGDTWSAYGDPTGDALFGVWAGDGEVVVVGAGGAIARRNGDDVVWTVEDSGVGSTLRAVFGRAPDDLWAVGDETAIVRYQGAGWEVAYSDGSVDLLAVWGPPEDTGNDIMAVGTGGRMVRYSGDKWIADQIASTGSTLHDIYGSGDVLVAVGTDSTITMKGGELTNWKGQGYPESTDELYAITGSAPDDLAVFGASGSLLRYDGSKWTVQEVIGPYFKTVDLVAADYRDGTWLAVGATGGGLRLTDDGWVDMRTQAEVQIRDLDGPDGDHLWAVGKSGLLMTHSISGWTSVPNPATGGLNAVVVDGDGVVWVAGDAGTVLRKAPDEVPARVETGLLVDLLGAAASPDAIYLSGKGGMVWTAPLGSSELEVLPTGTVSELRAAAWGGDQALWLAGAFGTLLRIAPEGEPEVIPTGVGGHLNDLAATETGVVVVGDNGVVLDATSDGVVQRHEQPGLFLYGVSSSPDATFAVGWNGTILRRDGEEFVAETSGVNAVLEAVWHEDGQAVAAGRQGALLDRLEGP